MTELLSHIETPHKQINFSLIKDGLKPLLEESSKKVGDFVVVFFGSRVKNIEVRTAETEDKDISDLDVFIIFKRTVNDASVTDPSTKFKITERIKELLAEQKIDCSVDYEVTTFNSPLNKELVFNNSKLHSEVVIGSSPDIEKFYNESTGSLQNLRKTSKQNKFIEFNNKV